MRIRTMTLHDVSEVACLCEELGYSATAAEVAERFSKMPTESHVVFVAEDNSKVVGWVHVFAYPHLFSEPTTELGGLVVDATVRGQGVGKQLMKRAEEWTLALGYKNLRLSSKIIREEAHRFYKNIGYELLKTSYYFSKKLD